jgi:hypothetical protein
VTFAATELHREIRDVLIDREVSAFDRKRRVADLVGDALESSGAFYRTSDGRRFFFSRVERRLYDIGEECFGHLLTALSGLSATENWHRFIVDLLQASAAREAPCVRVHGLAHYEPSTGALFVSDGQGGVWRRARHGQWTLGHNGDDSVFFLTDPLAERWAPEFTGEDALRTYLDGFLFGDDELLSADDKRLLVLVYLMHQLFPELRRTRVIPAFLGGQGSGKSSACRRIGRLLLGQDFDVSGIQRDREDAFVALVTNGVVAALDNADARITWLEDALATFATGRRRRYDLRRLYTTNERVSYEPRAILLINSRDPRFRRPDVAERLLPLHCVRPQNFRDEAQIAAELQALRPRVWGDLLTRAAALADALETLRPPALPFRMADFAAFGWCLCAPLGKAHEWLELLTRLERAQTSFAAEDDGVVAVLRKLLDREGSIRPIETGELFKTCSRIAEDDCLPFPRTAPAFGRRLTSLHRVIELELDVQFIEESAGGGKRIVSLIPRRGVGARS